MVWFVGAGPGDPELLTLKARRLIAAADVIVYAGSLVNPAVLAHARPDAELHDSAGMKLAEQIDVMCSAVACGRTVVRLHTGDPAIYGAILEQIRELEKHGVPYAVVPGVSSAFAPQRHSASSSPFPATRRRSFHAPGGPHAGTRARGPARSRRAPHQPGRFSQRWHDRPRRR